MSKFPNLERAVETINHLRHPINGCPWDLEQTHDTLIDQLLEEVYEYVHAIETKDIENMKEELGDLLLHIILHSKVAEQDFGDEGFDLEDVAHDIAEKMIFRHPHIFGADAEKERSKNLSSGEVLKNWEKLKEQEKEKKGESINRKEVMKEKYLHMPPLKSSVKIGNKAHDVGFDWENYQQTMYKVEEEWQEVKEELPPHGNFNKERVEDELGDLLFSICQLARHVKIDPEKALRKSNKKFVDRFKVLEHLAYTSNIELKGTSTGKLESLWAQAKKIHQEKKK